MSAVVEVACCPRCGRLPKLRVGFVYGGPGSPSRYSCYTYKYECRRWLGLRLCFGPQRENWLEKGWGGSGLGQRVARERWNAAAAEAAV